MEDNKNYIRMALLKYESISKLVDDAFIVETKKILNKMAKHPKLDILTINPGCKKLNFSVYGGQYADNLEFIKKHINKVCRLPMMSACLEYNNKLLSHDFRKLKYLKDQKDKNNIYKSLTSYINRASYNATYGGLMGIYSTIKITEGNHRSSANKLSLFVEKDRFISKNISKNTQDNIYLNPSIILKNTEVVYIKYENNKEQVIKIHNPLFVSILQIIKDQSLLMRNKLSFKRTIIKKGILRKKDDDLLNNIFNKMIELDLVRLRSKRISEVCFKDKKYIKILEVGLKKNIKLDSGNVYDLINENALYLNENIYSCFKKSASLYLDLLNGQLSAIHEEKVFLGMILRKYLKKINNDKCLLLDFVINHKDEILWLRKKRENYGLSYYENFISLIKLNV